MSAIKAVASTSAPAFAVNAEGMIIAWNEAAERRLGHRSAAVVGRPCWQVLNCCSRSFKSYSETSCPLRKRVFQGQPANREQLFFGQVDRCQMYFRNALGEPTRADTCTFMLQGEAGTRELVHRL